MEERGRERRAPADHSASPLSETMPPTGPRSRLYSSDQIVSQIKSNYVLNMHEHSFILHLVYETQRQLTLSPSAK